MPADAMPIWAAEDKNYAAGSRGELTEKLICDVVSGVQNRWNCPRCKAPPLGILVGILACMTDEVGSEVRVLVGYDGSLSAATAIQAGARLVPRAAAHVVYLWEPPYDFPELRHRLRREAQTVDQLSEALEREGLAEADRVAALGAAVAQPEGWIARPLVERCFGGVGHQFARLAEQQDSAMVVIGARGLGGLKAMLGSVSDLVVHVSPVPVLVVPHPLTTTEWAAASDGPVVVGDDGSQASADARARAAELFSGRRIIRVRVGNDDTDATGADTVTVTRRGHGAHGIADALCACARQHHAGVIVVASSGRSAGPKTLLGDVATAVAHHAQRPVLVVPTGERTG